MQPVNAPFADDPHYRAISTHYGDRRAERSQVPLINHINEGLMLLSCLGADVIAGQAFCLHPLVQSDDALREFLQRRQDSLDALGVVPLALAMEYRAVANSYLSPHYTGPDDEVALSTVANVNLMLVADKVQNRKDFERFHLHTHPRARELDGYFKNWLRALGVSESDYRRLSALIA